MNIRMALHYMSIEEAIELESRRFFCNADETINSISIPSMKKQIPVKPKVMPKPLRNEHIWWKCGNCGADKHTNFRSNYCSFCGQRVDWSEYLENEKAKGFSVSDELMEHAKMAFPETESK